MGPKSSQFEYRKIKVYETVAPAYISAYSMKMANILFGFGYDQEKYGFASFYTNKETGYWEYRLNTEKSDNFHYRSQTKAEAEETIGLFFKNATEKLDNAKKWKQLPDDFPDLFGRRFLRLHTALPINKSPHSDKAEMWEFRYQVELPSVEYVKPVDDTWEDTLLEEKSVVSGNEVILKIAGNRLISCQYNRLSIAKSTRKKMFNLLGEPDIIGEFQKAAKVIYKAFPKIAKIIPFVQTINGEVLPVTEEGVLMWEMEKKRRGSETNKRFPNSKGTTLLHFIDRQEQLVDDLQGGGKKRITKDLAKVDYTFDFDTKTGYIWEGQNLYNGDNPIILSFKNIFDSLLVKSTLMRQIYQEMLDEVDRRWKDKRDDLRSKPIQVYPYLSEDPDFQVYSGYYNPTGDGKNDIRISNIAAPILLFDTNIKNGRKDPIPSIEHDIFHEFCHAYDSYLEKTLGTKDIEVILTPQTALIETNNPHINKTTTLGVREEFAVFMENRYRKEQEKPLRLSYPLNMNSNPFEIPDFIDIVLLEDGHIRKYFDRHDYDQ